MKETYTCPNIMSRFATFSGNPFINSSVIKWHLNNITTDFEGVKVIEAFRGAFGVLQPYLHPIRFESTSNEAEANIIVYFRVNGDSDLPQDFGKNTLAYAFSPSLNRSRVYFNDTRDWAEMHGASGLNLKKVAVHEFLHSLGLLHSNATEWPGDILNPTYTPNDNILVTQDTIDGLEFLYGNLKASIPTEPDPEDPDKPDTPTVDYKAIFIDILEDKKNLSRLRETSIDKIGKLLGLDTDAENKTKAQNLRIVANFLHLE